MSLAGVENQDKSGISEWHPAARLGAELADEKYGQRLMEGLRRLETSA
jgi:hypothetical protein